MIVLGSKRQLRTVGRDVRAVDIRRAVAEQRRENHERFLEAGDAMVGGHVELVVLEAVADADAERVAACGDVGERCGDVSEHGGVPVRRVDHRVGDPDRVGRRSQRRGDGGALPHADRRIGRRVVAVAPGAVLQMVG